MISLPNFAEYAESVNSEEELNETNYCKQQPVTMEFTFEEHDLLNDILNHSLEVIDFALGSTLIFDAYELNPESEIRKRYEMLEGMKKRSYELWSNRFNKN
jgi:hypothetical protein